MFTFFIVVVVDVHGLSQSEETERVLTFPVFTSNEVSKVQEQRSLVVWCTFHPRT